MINYRINIKEKKDTIPASRDGIEVPEPPKIELKLGNLTRKKNKQKTVTITFYNLKVQFLKWCISTFGIPFWDVKDNQPGFSFQFFCFSVTDKILKYHDETT